jgi:uncharacterized protein (TIGR02466 family)
MYNVMPMFAVPIYHSTIDLISPELVEFIKNSKYDDQPHPRGPATTTDVNILDDKNCIDLKTCIIEKITEYATECLGIGGIELYITTSWGVKFSEGTYGHKHMHGNSVLSGVVYLQTDDKSGKITFYKADGYSNLFTSTVVIPINEWNIYNSENWAVQPHSNSILLFPSTLRHSVEENQSSEDRLSLAFNCFVRGTFGSYGSKLIIK